MEQEILNLEFVKPEVPNVSTFKRKPGAVLTHIHNEKYFFPIWLKHYSKYYDPEDIYVINHNSTGEFLEDLSQGANEKKYNLITVHNDKIWSSRWVSDNMSTFQWFLLQSYESVLCCDVDELIVTDPSSKYIDLRDYYNNTDTEATMVLGFHIASDPTVDKKIDLNMPFLKQRNKITFEKNLCKPLFSKLHVRYNGGMHSVSNIPVGPDYQLLLFHLHYIELDWIIEREKNRPLEKWSQYDLENNFSYQNKPASKEEKTKFFLDIYNSGMDIPERFKYII